MVDSIPIPSRAQGVQHSGSLYVTESNLREEYVPQEYKDGCTVAVQSFAAD